MTPFPFESVYTEIAETLIKKGLPTDGDLPPVILLVLTNDAGKIVNVEPMPLAPLFRDNAGKDVVGQLLRTIVPLLPANACAILISEAYSRSVKLLPGENWKETRKRAGIPESLADDDAAEEIVLIQIYRPEGHRMGRLPISPTRTLEFSPLEEEHTASEGRFVPEATRPRYPN